MKSTPQVLAALNGLLADELAAISQYTVHASMAERWGYDKLSEYIEQRARGEMKHADILIGRILFLEGTPIVKLGQVSIGATAEEALGRDLAAEGRAVAGYNRAIKLCEEHDDGATREILEHILAEEDQHVFDIEALLLQIKQMGVSNWLSTQS